jgi:leucyl aminopeptidase
MSIQLSKIKQLPAKQNIAFLINSQKDLKTIGLEKQEIDFIVKKYPKDKGETFYFNRFGYWIIACIMPDKKRLSEAIHMEELRKEGFKINEFLKKEKEAEITVVGFEENKEYILSLTEGIALSSYSFDKYKKKSDNKKLSKINVFHSQIKESELKELSQLIDSVFICRDLVNEPGASLNATLLSSIIKEECEKTGVKVEVLGKSRIKSLKMNGLISVNKGSTNEPTFTIAEWKPAKSINKKPYVLVGKGITYDTGGLSLKPSAAMEAMKSDMAGAAAVFACIRAIALNNLNIHVIGLMPATDNIPGQNAIAPGDVITMANGKTVEVLNTDAEGRLILADALHYADKYNPELIIDVATLTGSASAAIGKYGIVGMHHNAEKQMNSLIKSSYNVYERIVEFPLWDEYDKEIESDIADIKNIGTSRNAGAITAGSFLKQFVSFPWIHLDIAGMGFMESTENYIGKGGSAVGVRLLYDFFKNKIA